MFKWMSGLRDHLPLLVIKVKYLRVLPHIPIPVNSKYVQSNLAACKRKVRKSS